MTESLSQELRRELREELADGRLTTAELANYLLSEEGRNGETASLAGDALRVAGTGILQLAVLQSTGQQPLPADGNAVGAAMLVARANTINHAKVICDVLVENNVIESYTDDYAADLARQITSLYIAQNTGARPTRSGERVVS